MTNLSFGLPFLAICLSANLVTRGNAAPAAAAEPPCVPEEIINAANRLHEETLRDHYGRKACSDEVGIKRERPGSSSLFRIVNGKSAAVRQWPWVVALTMGELGCGGVLMNKRFVVTAKHCTTQEDAKVTKPSDIKITAGSIRLKPKKDVTAQEFEATEIIAHPTTDIAILRLNKDATLNKEVWPIWFRGNDENETTSQLWGPIHLFQPETGEAAIAGWGVEDESSEAPSGVLRSAMVRLRHDKPCIDYYGREIYNGMHQYCAGGSCDSIDAACKESDTCTGDGGDPLMYYTNDHWVLLGVSSMGDGCARRGVPGIYTWTQFIQAWIEDNIKL